MGDYEQHTTDPDLFRLVWLTGAVWLFVLLVFGAVGAYGWYLKATVRPADDVTTEVPR